CFLRAIQRQHVCTQIVPRVAELRIELDGLAAELDRGVEAAAHALRPRHERVGLRALDAVERAAVVVHGAIAITLHWALVRELELVLAHEGDVLGKKAAPAGCQTRTAAAARSPYKRRKSAAAGRPAYLRTASPGGRSPKPGRGRTSRPNSSPIPRPA